MTGPNPAPHRNRVVCPNEVLRLLDQAMPTTTPPKQKPKPEGVTLEQLQAAIQSVRDRLGQRAPLTRAGVGGELARFAALPKATLDAVVGNLGYKSKAKSKKEAVEMIAERLLAGAIADARSQV